MSLWHDFIVFSGSRHKPLKNKFLHTDSVNRSKKSFWGNFLPSAKDERNPLKWAGLSYFWYTPSENHKLWGTLRVCLPDPTAVLALKWRIPIWKLGPKYNLYCKWLYKYYSRNRPVAKNNPKGKVNTSFKIKTRVANGDKRIAGILPNLSLVDGIHSKEVDRKSKYPSSLRSHLLFSIFSPKNNRAGAEPSYRRY